MNTWSNTVLTDKGLALMAKLTQGNTLNITKAMTGAGFVTPGFLSKQTEITDPKQTLSFKPVSYPETGKCAIPVALKNEGLTTGYEATQVGIFAEDPDEGEILFFISQAAEAGNGTTIPSQTEMPGYAAEWTFYIAYGQADKVEVTVDQAGAVSRAEFDERMKKCATLDAEGKVLEEQLPDTTYIPVTSEVPSDSDIWIDPDETAIEESHVTDRNNPHGVTIAQIGAAPAGYGLGDMLAEEPILADAHEIWKTGWYRVHPSVTANVPVSGVLRAEVYAYRYVTLTLYSNEYLSNDTTILRQCLVDGVWQDWEFVNPPMQLGVEYRTTKRHKGKPVYVVKMNMGALPNNGRIEASHVASVGDIVRHSCSIIRDYGSSVEIQTTPMFNSDVPSGCTPLAFSFVANRRDVAVVFLQTGSNMTAYQAEATLWFTKSTD